MIREIGQSTSSYPTVDEILAKVEPPLSEKHADYVRRSYEFAQKAHEGQRRRSGEPYFTHCANVARMLAEIVHDWPTLSAGLLHDTVEDCGVTLDQIKALVPDPVAELVDGVTKISAISFTSDREKQANNLRKMILAMARDVRVVLIKLCDRLHNMRTLQHLDPVRQKEIATATIEIYAPLAKRLGMERICRELEDLSFSFIQPVLYRKLADHIERSHGRYQTIIDKTQAILETSLHRALVPATISGRLKHIYSTYRKMLSQGLNFEEIHDLLAIRIITENVSQTYEALGIVHSRWKPVPGKFKDYIATPKPNGYRSLHTTVIGVDGEITEIQIRTREMHRAADEGIAAHWNYKEAGSGVNPEAVEAERLTWLRQLVDWLSDIRDPQEFMTAVKKDVFEASVFCYTPKGDVIEMPRGSTILDFAYHIHTQLGQKCAGGKVNHKMVPMRTVMKTGEMVEIVSSKSAHPTPDWLQIAQTSRARNKIRHWLKINDRDFFLDRGKSMLLEQLHGRGAGLGINEALHKLEAMAGQFSLPTADDVLVEIGFGTLKAGTVVSKLVPTEPSVAKASRKAKPKAVAPDTILVEGIPGALTRLSKCCSPKAGDPIVGFVTQGRGISIHAADCKSLQWTLETRPESMSRIIGARWGSGSDKLMTASIRVLCQDRKGLLTDITQAVSRLGVNIIRAQTNSNLKTNQAIIKLTVQIQTEDALNSLLTRLESIPSVRSLRRLIHE